MRMSPEALAIAHKRAMKTVDGWSEERRMDWEERAAVLEYERGNSRQDSELLAYWQFLKEGGR